MSYIKNLNSTQSLTNFSVSRPKIFAPFVPTIESSSFFPPDNYITKKNQTTNDINNLINDNPSGKVSKHFHEVDKNLNKMNTIARKPIIDMTIDIGDNDNRKILIFEGEQAFMIATRFCEENSLNQKCAELIATEIQHQIDNYHYKKKKEELQDENSKNIKKNRPKKLNPSFSSKSFKEGPLSSESENENRNSSWKERKLNGNRSNRSLSNFTNINLNTPKQTVQYSKPKGPGSNTNTDKKENFISKNMNNLISTPKNSSQIYLKKMPEEKKEETYTFHPKINKYKKAPIESQEKTYNRLYNLHKEKANRRSNAEEEWVSGNFSFKPETNCQDDRIEGMMTKKNIIERQIEKMQLNSIKTEKIKKEKEEFFNNYDPKTGQKLFEPRFSKDKYYYKVKEKEKKSQQIKIMEPPPELELASIPPSDLKTLSKLFKQLDSKSNGALSNRNMEIGSLGNELLEILGEVFTEEIKNRNTIKFEDFCIAIKKSGKLELISQILIKNEKNSFQEKDKERKSVIHFEKEKEGGKGVGRKMGSVRIREGEEREMGMESRREGTERDEGSVRKRMEIGRELGSAAPMKRDDHEEKNTVYEKIEGHFNELEKFQEKQMRPKTPKITSKYKEIIEKSFK